MGKRAIPLILAGCIFLGGCALLAYPKVSQWLNNLHQSEVIADYSSAIDGLDDEEAEKELRRAADYWSWYGFSSRVEWCACFVSWCADQCGYIESGVIPKHSYCPTGVEWFRSRGQWQDRNSIPAPGTIIYFDWGGDGVADHVGDCGIL